MDERILQVHPTRRCNLRCRHCYSDSGPESRQELPCRILDELVRDAVAEGYDVLSVSGGEPFLYGHLPVLLGAARRAGMRTMVTSNGTRLGGARLGLVADQIDLLALSLDGTRPSHDRMRGSGAFDALLAGVTAVKAHGMRFGFLFTLTEHNLDELDWVVSFAVEHGASLLQVHPLAPEGRARVDDGTRDAVPSPFECVMALVLAARARCLGAAPLAFQVDVAPIGAAVETLRAACARAGDPGEAGSARLADLVAPLVVEASGLVVPHQHGLRRFALGSLLVRPLREMAAWFREEGAAAYAEFLAGVAGETEGAVAGDPYAWISRKARTWAPRAAARTA